MSNIPNTPTLQNIIINFIGQVQITALAPMFKHINNAGGNIIHSKINQFGSNICGYLLVDGPWNTITKLEQSIKNLEKEYQLQFISQRDDCQHTDNTEVKDAISTEESDETIYLPYKISINNLDEPGILEKICSFFALQEITVIDLATNSYTSEYNGELVQVDIKIKIPSDIHIPSIREQFDVLCYNENLDASLVPYKIS